MAFDGAERSQGEDQLASSPPGAPDVTLVDGSVVPTPLDFERFFAEHHEPVLRALALTLGDAEQARDAAAEGMARAYQRWGRIRGYDDPAGWVYRVGLNWARSRWRKSRREVVTDAVVERPGADPPGADPRLAAALAGLGVDQRAVVVLRYYLDWSEARTAAALDVAPGTVKSRLSRALDRLAVALADGDAVASPDTDPTTPLPPRGGPDGTR